MNQDTIINHKLTNLVHTIFLIGGMIIILALLGFLIAGVNGLIWAVVIGVTFLVFTPRVSPQMILRMYGARALQPQELPELYQLIQALARRAGLAHVPILYYIPSKLMNAFAMGSRDEAVIGITDGLLRTLNTRELTGVLAHEISHISNNDLRVMALADVISRITNLFSTFGQFLLLLNLPLLLVGMTAVPWLAVILLIAAPLLSDLLQLALSRTREFDADLGAVALTGDPEGLASALKKIEYYSTNMLKRILMPGHSVPDPSILRTHPNTGERINRLLQLLEVRQPSQMPGMLDQLSLPQHFSEVSRGPRRRMSGLWY